MNNVKLVWLLALGLLLISGAGWYSQRLTRSLQRKPPPSSRVASPNSAPRPDPRQVEAQAASLRAAVAARPQDLRPRWALVALYGQAGQKDQAVAQVDAIEHLNPTDLPDLMSLGNTRMLLKQYTRAEQEYRQILKRQPALPAAQQGLATALYKQERYYEALQAAQQAVATSPKDPGARLVLALSALRYGQAFPSADVHRDALFVAQKEFGSLTKTMPGNPDILFHEGETRVVLGDFAGSQKSLAGALALTPRLDAFQELTRAKIATGDRIGAQKVVDEALAHYPNDPDLHDLRGQILQASETPDGDTLALAEFQKAVQGEPQSTQFQQRLGTACLRVGKLPEAHAAFEAAIRIDPNDPFPFQQLAATDARLGDAAGARAAAQVSTGLTFDAQQLKQIETLAEVHPDSIPLHLILADRYRQLHLDGAARDEYLLVRHLDPANSRAKQGLAAMQGGSLKPQAR